MRRIEQSFTVSFEYPVVFGRGLFSPVDKTVVDVVSSKEPGRRHRAACLVESAVAAAFPELLPDIVRYFEANIGSLDLAAAPVVIGGGESFKSFSDLEWLLRTIADMRLCRQSFVLIVGGGAFLDAVGLAASLAHRGVRQVRFPTTVLSQCDSGVGVKNGVNMFGQKNYAGVFSPPFAVVCDFDFLDRLERRDWIAGVAEAFKVSLIKDAEFFNWLCVHAGELAGRSKAAMEEMVIRCADIHLKHIARGGDPFEFGSAKPLDFGHWAAHRLEMMSGGALRHGEAVAIGLAIDCLYAVESGLLDERTFNNYVEAAGKVGLPLWSDLLDGKEPAGSFSILKGIEEFHEHLGGDLSVTMPNGLGGKTEVCVMDERLVMACVERLRSLWYFSPLSSARSAAR